MERMSDDGLAIWRYSPDGETRCGVRRRDDYTIGEESVSARGAQEGGEVVPEVAESRDYSGVYSNGQSDPHQSQRAASPSVPDTLV